MPLYRVRVNPRPGHGHEVDHFLAQYTTHNVHTRDGLIVRFHVLGTHAYAVGAREAIVQSTGVEIDVRQALFEPLVYMCSIFDMERIA